MKALLINVFVWIFGDSLNLSLDDFDVPTGWWIDFKRRGKKKFSLTVRPPDGRKNGARLDVSVFQYTEFTSDPQKLAYATNFNLKNSTLKDSIKERHGVHSHELFYQEGKNYRYIIRFITHFNEFVIRWSCPDKAVFEKHLSDIDSFVNSFEFIDLKVLESAP